MEAHPVRPCSTQDILVQYQRFYDSIAQYKDPNEQRILLGYLLHSLRVSCGKHQDLFDEDTATESPEYHLYDSGRVIQGKSAIIDYLGANEEFRALLMIPPEQHIAVGPWGFATEQLNHIVLPPGGPTLGGGCSQENAVTFIKSVHLALVWRCDDQGRLESARFYPAKAHSSARADGESYESDELATALEPLLAQVINQRKADRQYESA